MLATRRARNTALALLATAQFVVVVDASIVNVALPSIGRDLRVAQESLSWVISAYTLVYGGLLLLGGRLADLLGGRRVFVSGLVVFAVASLAGGLAQSEWQLIAARCFQGLGAALASPASLLLVTTIFAEGTERNRALGIWGATAGAGGAAGVLLGGVLTEYLSWRWVLYVNVPIGIVAGLLSPRLLPAVGARRSGRLDLPGAVGVTAGLSVLIYAIIEAQDAGWTSAQTLGLGALGLILLAAFVAIESRVAQPLLPLSIFRLRTLRGGNVVAFFAGAALLGMFYLLSLYLQVVLDQGPLEAGLAFLPLSVAIIVSAAVASKLTDVMGVRATLVAGGVFVTLGLAWFSRISVNGSFLADVLGPSVLAATGLGLSFVGITIAAVTGVGSAEAGLASGLSNASRQIGGALGIAILASVAASVAADSDSGGDRATQLAGLTDGFQAAFLVGAGFAATAAVAAAVLVDGRSAAAQPESDVREDGSRRS